MKFILYFELQKRSTYREKSVLKKMKVEVGISFNSGKRKISERRLVTLMKKVSAFQNIGQNNYIYVYVRLPFNVCSAFIFTSMHCVINKRKSLF